MVYGKLGKMLRFSSSLKFINIILYKILTYSSIYIDLITVIGLFMPHKINVYRRISKKLIIHVTWNFGLPGVYFFAIISLFMQAIFLAKKRQCHCNFFHKYSWCYYKTDQYIIHFYHWLKRLPIFQFSQIGNSLYIVVNYDLLFMHIHNFCDMFKPLGFTA